MLEKPFAIGQKKYDVTAIVATDYKKFLSLNEMPQSRLEEMAGQVGEFMSNEKNLYSRIIVNKGFYEAYAGGIRSFSTVYSFQTPKANGKDQWDMDWLSDGMAALDQKMIDNPYRSQFLYVPKGFKELKDDEMLVPFESLWRLGGGANESFLKKIQEGQPMPNLYQELRDRNLIPDGVTEVYIIDNERKTRIEKLDMKVVGVVDMNRYQQFSNVEDMYDYVTSHGRSFNKQQMSEAKGDFNRYYSMVYMEYMRLKLFEIGIDVPTEQDYYGYDKKMGNENKKKEQEQQKQQKQDYWGYMKNLVIENNIEEPGMKQFGMPLVVDPSTFERINPFKADNVQEILVQLSKDKEYDLGFFQYTEDHGYRQDSISGTALNIFGDFVKEASKIFTIISIGLAFFSVILMYTNLSSSVLTAKREIGTLRAIGARGRDVAMIFVTEAMILAVLTALFANIGVIAVTSIINSKLSEQMGISMSLFNPSVVIMAEILGLAALVVFVAAYIPVKAVSRMKPIDAIKK